jgi:hypothetical protein
MYLLAALPFSLVAFCLVVVVYRLAKLNARLRANLTGCTGYPSSRRSAAAHLPALHGVPLRYGKGRAAERSWCREEIRLWGGL